jgi:hypothetical protein
VEGDPNVPSVNLINKMFEDARHAIEAKMPTHKVSRVRTYELTIGANGKAGTIADALSRLADLRWFDCFFVGATYTLGLSRSFECPVFLGILTSGRFDEIKINGISFLAGNVAVAIRDDHWTTATHELGHSFGQSHPSAGGWDPTKGPCGETTKSKAEWPYLCTPSQYSHGSMQDAKTVRACFSPFRGYDDELYGWDSHLISTNAVTRKDTIIDPHEGNFELMSYCGSANQKWPSDITYHGVLSNMMVHKFNPTYMPFGRTLDSESSGEFAEYCIYRLDVDFLAGTASIRSPLRFEGPTGSTDVIDGTWELRINDGMVDSAVVRFEPLEFAATDEGTFHGRRGTLFQRCPSTLYSLSVVNDQGQEVNRVQASANAPTVALESPIGGEIWSGEAIDIT